MEAAYTISRPEDQPENKVQPFAVEALPADLRNGLLVRMPNHLGDAVMALPALRQFKALLPAHCGLFVLAPESQAALYRALPFVDSFVGLRKLHCMWSIFEWKEVRQLRAGAAVLCSHSFRDALLLRLCGIPYLYGAAARNRSFLLTRAFPFPPRRPGDASGSHQLYRYYALAAAFGAPAWDGAWPETRLPVRSDEIRRPFSAFCRHGLLLTMAPGAAYGAAKRWPAGHFRSAAAYWIRRGGIVVVTGSPAEAAIGNEVLQGLDPRKCFNICGKTDLQALMVLIANSALVLANDSGVMHLAALLGKPGIAVFGPTDETDTCPLRSRWVLLKSTASCRPCLKRVCPRGVPAPCMQNIRASAVLRVMRRMAQQYHWPWTQKLKRTKTSSQKEDEKI